MGAVQALVRDKSKVESIAVTYVAATDDVVASGVIPALQGSYYEEKFTANNFRKDIAFRTNISLNKAGLYANQFAISPSGSSNSYARTFYGQINNTTVAVGMPIYLEAIYTNSSRSTSIGTLYTGNSGNLLIETDLNWRSGSAPGDLVEDNTAKPMSARTVWEVTRDKTESRIKEFAAQSIQEADACSVSISDKTRDAAIKVVKAIPFPMEMPHLSYSADGEIVMNWGWVGRRLEAIIDSDMMLGWTIGPRYVIEDSQEFEFNEKSLHKLIEALVGFYQ